ncbi:MAG: MAC/perforin domain-containing protein [Myxococcota bacterium]
MRENYLTEIASDLINAPDVSPRDVISIFGTHVLMDAVYGARFEHSASINTWAYEARTAASVAIEASFNTLSGSGSANSSFASENEEQQYMTHSNRVTRAAGGRSEIARGPENLDEWQATIDENPLVLVQMLGDRPLLPIWEFARSEARRDELQAAVKALEDQAQGSLGNLEATLKVDLKIKTHANKDQKGGLELYGQVGVEIVDEAKGSVAQSTLFSRARGHDFTLSVNNGEKPAGSATMVIGPDHDPRNFVFKTTGFIMERDGGGNSDDFFGNINNDVRFVEGAVLGNRRFRLDIIELIFDLRLIS